MTPDLIDKLRHALELAGGTHTIDDVWEQVREGSAQLWVEEGACLVTEVQDTPRKRVLRFWLAAGELEPTIALSRKVLAWGKEQGCDMASLTGRRGWDKVLREEGWSPSLTVMTREV